ncbi:unnamed protein product [Meloidogyne enterolobii]|uniref:Uncharacterized protein n=2 Tax=Meloidogyne enterolobii TaxID=390850 RepID=A0ACB0YJY0_MELEN
MRFIRSVFVIIDDESNIADEENKQGLKSHSIASKTHSFLTSLCSLLDCFRQTSAIPSIVVLFHSFGTVKEEFLLPHLDICLPLHPIVQCKTEKSARFSSLHALCHAFAVSYKMNIQIGLIGETTGLICNRNVFLEFECLSGLKSEEKSEINFFELGRIDGDEEIFTFTRLLLFSNVKLEEQQKQQAIQSLSSLQNDCSILNENTKFAWSKMPSEEFNDDKIEKEIFENWPSHLVFFQKEKEDEKFLGEGGPANLKKNICSNLFSPWLLKQVCSEFRINFVEFPQQKSFEKMKMNMEEVKNRKEIVDFFEKKLENLIMKMEG